MAKPLSSKACIDFTNSNFLIGLSFRRSIYKYEYLFFSKYTNHDKKEKNSQSVNLD